MPPPPDHQPEPQVSVMHNAGHAEAQCVIDGRPVSVAGIIPLRIRVGAAVVRMDGIGGVSTEEAYRNRGLSRRVMEAAVVHMIDGDAAISMLYGISDFYTKFGYATAGAEHHLVYLPSASPQAGLPDGWTVRLVCPQDVESVRNLYDRGTAGATGVAIRSADARVWRHMAKLAAGQLDPKKPDECRVVLDASGVVCGYIWRGDPFWSRRFVAEANPDRLVIAEAMAADPLAADAVLQACRMWCSEPTATPAGPAKGVVLSLPPDNAIARAAMFGSAEVRAQYNRCGGSMVRLLSPHRLLSALVPELESRLALSGHGDCLTLHLITDMGSIVLRTIDARVTLCPPDLAGPDALVVRLPQADLARLAVGAMDPLQVMARLPSPASAEAARLIEMLFPMRPQHMYLPDRY